MAGWGGLKEWNLRNAVPLPERELRTVFESMRGGGVQRRCGGLKTKDGRSDPGAGVATPARKEADSSGARENQRLGAGRKAAEDAGAEPSASSPSFSMRKREDPRTDAANPENEGGGDALDLLTEAILSSSRTWTTVAASVCDTRLRRPRTARQTRSGSPSCRWEGTNFSSGAKFHRGAEVLSGFWAGVFLERVLPLPSRPTVYRTRW